MSVQASAAVPAVVDASTATAVPATSTASTSTTEPEVKVAPVPVPVVVEVVPEPEWEVVVPVVEAPVVVHVEVIPEVPEPVVIAVVPEVASLPSAPRSYSDMARAAASSSNAPASPSRFGARPPNARPSSSAPKVAEVPKPSPAANTPSFSVYVKQVPEAATESAVLAIFSRFGTVKRVELNGPRGFAFVDYDSAASVQSCLSGSKEAPLELAGAILKVEERNSKGGGGGPGGNSGGGRNKSGVRRDGENRGERREGGGRGPPREGGDRERRDKDRRGPKPESNGASNGTATAKPTAQAGEGNGARVAKK